MLKRVSMNGMLVVTALLACATAASAQDRGRQTVNFTLGYFTPLGFEARDDDDVLNADRTFLLFDGSETSSGSANLQALLEMLPIGLALVDRDGRFLTMNQAFRNQPNTSQYKNLGRGNHLFFDGHVETMGDLQGANPDLWAPRGTRIPADEAYPDVARKYFAGRPDPIVVP